MGSDSNSQSCNSDRNANWSLTPTLVDTVLLQLLAERVAVQAQQLGGARLVALRLEHDHLEHGLFHGGYDHLVDAGAFLPVQVLEILAHHLAHRGRELVVPGRIRPAAIFRLQARHLVLPRTPERPSEPAGRRRIPSRRRAGLVRHPVYSCGPGTRRSSAALWCTSL